MPIRQWIKNISNKMLIKLDNKINLSTDHFNRELGNIRKTQSKIHHSISELKNTLKAVNNIKWHRLTHKWSGR